MNAHQWLELALYIAALVLVTKPLGLYINRVLDANGRTWLDPVLRPLENSPTACCGVDPEKEQDWKQYTFAMLLFSLVSCLFTYAILRLQQFLPLNPQGFGALSPHLAFNTAVSFTTNTNWQSYGGESTMSYLSQMVALAIHNFVSAAVGIAIAAALVRGIARHTAKTIGNFWVDLVRITYYLLLPICLVLGAVPRVAGHDPELQALHHGQADRAANHFRPEDRRERQAGRGRQGQAGDGRTRRSTRRPSCKGRWRRRSPSRCSAPTAAVTPTPTPRIRLKIPRRFPTFSRCSPSSASAAG